jgi:ZIP family zinc transporter
MSVWLEAGLWGLLAGGALVLGALVAWFIDVPRTVVASIMAFGAGVLISALAFDLLDEAEASGGLTATLVGFLAGAAIYVLINTVVARRGARHRKRSDQQSSETDQPGSGTAIAIGALLDGIPEAIVLGLSLLGGTGVGVPILTAIFISNVPEGLSSTAGMKRAGRSFGFVFAVWGGIAAATGLAGLLGCLLLQDAPVELIAAVTAVAAGAILTMVADTMIPEAFERTHLYVGLIATLGFALSFSLQRMG